MEVEPWRWAPLDYPRSKGVSIRSSTRAGARQGSLRKASSSAEKTEPPVGFEPTTARLRIESSTTELRWRPPNLAACCSTRYSTSPLVSRDAQPGTAATFLFLGRESSPSAHCGQGQNRNAPRHRVHVMPPI